MTDGQWHTVQFNASLPDGSWKLGHLRSWSPVVLAHGTLGDQLTELKRIHTVHLGEVPRNKRCLHAVTTVLIF